jgi:hypothetical protein
MSKEQVVVCSYCGRQAELVNGNAIYPHRPDLSKKLFYRCAPCGAYVGCDPGTKKPLGSLANAELRKVRSDAHAVFDPKWRSGAWGSRHEAYAKLAKMLGVATDECHIGGFDFDTCQKVVALCK